VALAFVFWAGRRERRRLRITLEASLADQAELRDHLIALERRIAAPSVRDAGEYTITTLGEPTPEDDAVGEPAPMVPAPLFADLVLRESVVHTASFLAGLRRALAPETRNRIRFEMKREVKRARKQRKADLRQARREYEARQRANLDVGVGAA